MHKRAVFVNRTADTINFGHTGTARTDASSKDGYWFLPDGMQRAALVQPADVWFDDDNYIVGPPNYK